MANGQSSLEALLSLAALLCALGMLAHAAKAQSDALASAVEAAEGRAALARDAFGIDLAADMLPGARLQRNMSGVPVSEGNYLALRQSGAVREPLFHRISADADGEYHAQSE
ncbi:MAG: hypothetical protein WC717_00260 [Candidatus Micrarchaeia archaeon]|jgi:hypothetical protein